VPVSYKHDTVHDSVVQCSTMLYNTVQYSVMNFINFNLKYTPHLKRRALMGHWLMAYDKLFTSTLLFP
jgi:hypothetical protein